MGKSSQRKGADGERELAGREAMTLSGAGPYPMGKCLTWWDCLVYISKSSGWSG